MTFETFDQRDEETWPDQQKDNDNDKDKDKDNDKDKDKDNDKDNDNDNDNDKDNDKDKYIHSQNTFKERSLRLVTFEAFDQSG